MLDGIIAHMKKTLKHFLISIFAILSGVSVAYASFGPFAGSGAISENSEIDPSIPIWNSLQVKGNTVVSIATGASHSLAVTSSRKGVCLGERWFWSTGKWF